MNKNQGRRRTRRARQLHTQKNTQISRILLTICMMALVAAVSIGGTLAWLTDNTTPVVNTFTQSDVDIELTENDSDGDGDALNNSYKMIPGNTIAKNPTVTVKADSEECYVFVKLVKENDFDNYLTYQMAEGWTSLTTESGVYYRTVSDTDADQTIGVIANDQVTVLDTVTKGMMDNLTTTNYPKLTVTAYAIQTANTGDAAQAWAKLNVTP